MVFAWIYYILAMEIWRKSEEGTKHEKWLAGLMKDRFTTPQV